MKTSGTHTDPGVETLSCHLVVAGGGIGGVVAAITAARHGCKVILIQDRSVLGGNASSEINVGIGGANAMGYNKDARETGVIDEILVENSARSTDHSCRLLDDVLWEWVEREPNIQTFLNTQVTRVTKDAEDRIAAIHALRSWSEQDLVVRAAFFADCTGDAVVAHEAGASWRMGREGKAEFGESLAQDVPDTKVLGCSLPFQFKDTGKPVAFTAPSFARDFSSPDSFPFRDHNRLTYSPWWAEWGGELDPIYQYQEIKDELTKIVYGLWDHLKNHGDHGMENHALIRLSPILGKRESRRVEGPLMLTQNDVMSRRKFPDAVAYGGWPVDLHPPEGIDFRGVPAEQYFVDPYEIPLRCLYSKTITNLFLVGRDISVSHVALGTTRVMGTIATMGQAVGTAVALCLRDRIQPGELEPRQIAEIQQTLLRDDAYLINQRNEDSLDVARNATATATSDAPLAMEDGDQWQALESGCAQLFPVTAGRIDSVSLLLNNTSGSAAEVSLTLHPAEGVLDFSSSNTLATATASLLPGHTGWCDFPLNCPASRGFYWVALSRAAGVSWRRNSLSEPQGTKTAQWDSTRNVWSAYRGYHIVETATWVSVRDCYAFRLTPAARPHTADQAINGVNRPVDCPNAWVSDPTLPLPQSITLRFKKPVVLGRVLLTFDTDLDHRVPQRFSARTVKHYRLWAEHNGVESVVAEVNVNYQRRRIHRSAGIRADAIRLAVRSAHGAQEARVLEVRVYESPDLPLKA